MELALDDELFIIELVGNAGAEAIAGADAIIFCGGTGLGKLIEFVVGAGAIMLL